MKDYYHILGINSDASQDEIKSAYKSLALKYHPDRNRGSTNAEELFKNINQAYQVLSDPYKKEKYDLVMSYRKKPSGYEPFQTYQTAPKEEKPYYERYGKFDWRDTPKYAKANVYKIDKNYYRMQLWTIGALLLAFVLITSGSAITDHYAQISAQEEALAIENNLKLAQQHFSAHHYDSTFNIIHGLMQKYPSEASYRSYSDDYVDKIRNRGMQYFQARDYVNAIHELNDAKTYIDTQDLAIWSTIGQSHLALSSFQKAIDAFDYVFIREPFNIELCLQIGDLYLKLDDKVNALSYYSGAKAIFKERQTSIYGEAFELVIRPAQLDTSYFFIFQKRGQLNYELGNYEEAATDYNWAIFLNEEYNEGFALRAECWLGSDNLYRACQDWREAYRRGDTSKLDKIQQYCQP